MAKFTDRLDEARQTHKLNLGYCELEEFPATCLEVIKKQNIRIRELELSSNQLNVLTVESSAVRHLMILRLKYNKFTSLPRVVLELKFLTVLELSGNQITVVDDFVKDLTSVKELDLSGNNITTLPEAICQMPSLEVLHVEHNRIDELPSGFGQLKTLVRINLSTNAVRSLPSSVAMLKRLQRINCANNLLTTVPPEMGFLKTLKEFNLRSNNLNDQYKAKVDEGLSRFLAFLREEHERVRLEEIERSRPVGTQFGAYLEYRCKADPKKAGKNKDGITFTDNRCWIRTGQSVSQVGSRIYLFGGCLNKDGMCTNDLFWISTERMEWTKDAQSTGEKSCPRHNHNCVHDPEHRRLLIFGGRSDNKKRSNDLYAFDLEKTTWSKVHVSGAMPLPREHASALYWAEQLILFGGMGSGSRLNDTSFLDLSSMTWSQPPVSGTAPSPRQSAALCLVNSTQLLLHGGQNHFVLDDLFVFDILSKTWSPLYAKGQKPPPRHSHHLCFSEGSVYLYGGVDELGASVHTLYKLEISSNTSLSQQDLIWKEIESELEPNASRTSLLHDGRIAVFQVGSRTLGIPSADNIEKGLVQWDVFKVASLADLTEKRLETDSLKLKNPKLCRIQHTMTILPKMPKAYTIQTPKEKRLVEYAERFQKTFFRLYPHRRPLILTPMNECGVRKFACSWIRPTKLHASDLCTLDGVCRFVADAIQYEPLENALHPPLHWTSPTSTLKWQSGDAFDLAVLLTSLLIGVGYDAYVCVGYAPEEIVKHDQTSIRHGFQSWEEMLAFVEHPHIADITIAEEQSDEFQSGKYIPRLPVKYADVDRESAEGDLAIEKPDPETDACPAFQDEMKSHAAVSKCIHAWVMIAPASSEVTERLMIEPSTGVTYKTCSCPYEGIEFIFNHENFWICMQMPTADSDSRAKPTDVLFDLDDPSAWERVLPKERSKASRSHGMELLTDIGNTDIGQQGYEKPHPPAKSSDAVAETRTENMMRGVDVPSSWVSRLHISDDVFNMRCPRGHKMIVYKNCTHEKFALFGESARWDGMIDCFTYYEDVERKKPIMLDCHYSRRKDKLARKCTKMQEERIVDVHESFLPGNPHTLKTIRRTHEKRDFVEFYEDGRVDGLISREERFGEKTIDLFANRSDRLIYRSTSFKDHRTRTPRDQKESDQPTLEIQKLTEKFLRNYAVDCDSDIAKRVFYLAENRIRIDFHFGDGRITRSSRIFHKEGRSQIIQVNPHAPKLTPAAVHEEFHNLLAAEKECLQVWSPFNKSLEVCVSWFQGVRDMEKEIKDLMMDCQTQDLQVKLVTPYYDAARDRVRVSIDEDKDNTSESDHDYLKPFLPKSSADATLSKDQALNVREKCLRSLKERLIERANIMQARHNEESSSLNKLTANYNRDKDQMTLEQVHDYEQTCALIKFRVNILEKRLKRHEEQALQRYVRLDQKLRKDDRLKSMLAKH